MNIIDKLEYCKGLADFIDTPEDKHENLINSNIIDYAFKVNNIEAVTKKITASPLAFTYHIELANPFKEYNETKIKKIIKSISNHLNIDCSFNPSNITTFSVAIVRNPKAYLFIKNVAGLYAFYDLANLSSVALGENINGDPVIFDIAKCPHLLIAGTTGSGKSVALNTIITSLLLRNSKNTARFIMIDPKKTELYIYERLPHLLRPIVKNPLEAVEVLRDVCQIMDERYKEMAEKNVKNLSDCPELFPRLYVVIDELADLMLTSKKACELYIVRLAQLGRACGIHLIVATQKPTANIITGLIETNMPSKLCLAVGSVQDSVRVLGYGGAEKLTGRGDALLKLPSSLDFTRLQCAFSPDEDIVKTVDFWVDVYAHKKKKNDKKFWFFWW